MSKLTLRGKVESGEFPVAGVTLIAQAPTGMAPEAKDQSARLPLGRAVTDSDGIFTIETDENDALIARCACVLRSCREFKFHLQLFDGDRLLHETEPLSYEDELSLAIGLREPEAAVASEDWSALGERMEAGQMGRLDDVASELARLAPRGVFRDWNATRRLAMLGQIEQALLDPRNVLGSAGFPMRFARLSDEAEVAGLREQFRSEERPELLDALEVSLERARKIDSWAELHVPAEPERFKRGDYLAGVNEFIDQPELYPGAVIGSKSSTIGYRDYLRDRWIDNQRFEPVLGGPDKELASRATMIERLNNRFHQDFATQDLSDRPANRVLIPILVKMLTAAPGTVYGFGFPAAAIDDQGAVSHGDYVDYLISRTELNVEELEKRYRLNLRRSDLERSNAVQQNIETLQRLFTDSYQSVEDPFAVKPDRKPGKDELLISLFPAEGAGPFFLEYEEWLAREEPFFPENHYDPRATYSWTLGPGVKELVFTKSIPLADFLKEPKSKYLPGGSNHAVVKWQWVRNHIELHECILAAHNDARSLKYSEAEEKYAQAQAWAGKLREFFQPDWDYAAAKFVRWDYGLAAEAKSQKAADVSTLDKLAAFERTYHLSLLTQRFSYGSWISDFLSGNTEITENWWGGPNPKNRTKLAYLIDHLYFRLLPACLAEMQLAQGKYAETVRQLIGTEGIVAQVPRWLRGPAGFNIFAAAPHQDPLKAASGGKFAHIGGGPLPYASWSDRTQVPPPDGLVLPGYPPPSLPANRAELGYFKLKLGNAALEWADVLYRSNQPENIMRARELYKAVIFLYDEDPEISPNWARFAYMPPFPWKKSRRNPAIVSQVNRARLGFFQINSGLNYYGVTPTHVPPVRYRALKEAADRFAAGARGAQADFLAYMQQLDEFTVAEMQARAMVAKASAAISIAQEQQKIAEFNVGEVQKQVDAINGQIAAKKAEIAKKDEFFEQVKEFAGGMKDSVGKLGELAFAGESQAEAATAQNLSTGDILKLGFKIGTASNVLGGATQALGGAAGVAGPFGAFLYAGVSSMTSMADAIAKRAGELAHLENIALPAAKALVELKKRDVTIAQLSQTIARADWQLGNDLLAHYSRRFQNRAFLVSMAEFSNRLMRRYLDLAGRTAWFAERALAFEQDRELGIVAFDYFPRNLRGVSGADLLQLHLAELEAARIQGLTQTIPVKQTISLARDFPMEFGQLKKTGSCRFATSEASLRLVYPGVYGYRVRNITVAATCAEPIAPHRGLFSNQGVSVVSRDKPGSDHMLVRYPDVLPLSEFRMRDDMWVFDLPDETLLPFEGSGIGTTWELVLSKAGNANGFASITDMLVTFDMRASYSAVLEKQHIAALPGSVTRTLLVSAKAMNPGALAKFRDQGGQLTLRFDLAKLAHNRNETQRKTLNFVLAAVGVKDTAFAATFSSAVPAQSQAITFEKGIALSNAGALAGGNAGVPLPLNTFAGVDVDQTFTLKIDSAANAGIDFTNLSEVLLLLEYEATL